MAATAAALGLLALLALSPGRASIGLTVNTARDDPLAFAVPLTLLSMVAVAWTSVPLFLLPACLWRTKRCQEAENLQCATELEHHLRRVVSKGGWR
jgi:hypothetical protein